MGKWTNISIELKHFHLDVFESKIIVSTAKITYKQISVVFFFIAFKWEIMINDCLWLRKRFTANRSRQSTEPIDRNVGESQIDKDPIVRLGDHFVITSAFRLNLLPSYLFLIWMLAISVDYISHQADTHERKTYRHIFIVRDNTFSSCNYIQFNVIWSMCSAFWRAAFIL